MDLPHIPCLRWGVPYVSLNQNDIIDYRDRRPLARVSQVNAGVVRRDMRQAARARAALGKKTVAELIEISSRAGEFFLREDLPLGEGDRRQTAEDYVTTLSATSGLPHVMVRRNMEKIHYALTHMEVILTGLTRKLDFGIVDQGYGEQHGTRIGLFPTTDALGLVMPSNSPAVNSLWLPAIALKIPVVIKPGREEPWTPYRLIQAFLAAGCPAEAFGFYPTDHEGADAVWERCGRALVFGGQETVDRHAGNPGIQVHGPGYSKIILGEDEADNWQDYLELMAASVVENGGRSCINASAIVTPRHGQQIAEALGRLLGPIKPAPVNDEEAKLSGFANPAMAEYIDRTIEEELKTPGARDCAAPFRNGDRQERFDGGNYLRPSVIYCESTDHPLYNREFLCPYVSVVEVPPAETLARIGYSLVVTAITKDQDFIARLLDSPEIARLNLGPIPTMKVSWDQPHEGNMFELLYRRRSIEFADGLGPRLAVA